jgi:hypothetical protein
VYRITADFLTERGLMDEVKGKLSPASRRVLEKLGMTYRGRTRVFGIDAVYYDIEQEEFESNSAS